MFIYEYFKIIKDIFDRFIIKKSKCGAKRFKKIIFFFKFSKLAEKELIINSFLNNFNKNLKRNLLTTSRLF